MIFDDEEDFIKFSILTSNMSEAKVDSVPTLSMVSEYKGWEGQNAWIHHQENPLYNDPSACTDGTYWHFSC